MAKKATVKQKARRSRYRVNSRLTSRPSLHRKRTVKIIPVDLDDVMDEWDTDVPCASDIERSGSDTESIISISSVSSKASSKAKVGPKSTEDHRVEPL
ncbi:hypothetical protein NLI96_g10505 [Meripilus lineatus]|uniref:Uncharacterized protein n=1 Tax=Meripilus lineatus TaxID=2056292 RepID=A0AAD5UTS9_9APHY|nr:hypothetical protein NLI96_g10505 [Physisporinus lineatus]